MARKPVAIPDFDDVLTLQAMCAWAANHRSTYVRTRDFPARFRVYLYRGPGEKGARFAEARRGLIRFVSTKGWRVYGAYGLEIDRRLQLPLFPGLIPTSTPTSPKDP